MTIVLAAMTIVLGIWFGLAAANDAGLARGYCRIVLVAAALACVLAFIAAGLAWTARLLYVGNLDARALAEKTAAPSPTSALDWPELQLRDVVAEPGEPPLVLLRVSWPAYPRREATLLVAVGHGDKRSLSLLSQWCASAASISPVRQYGAELELRRRQSLECVHAVLLAEDDTTGA